MVLFITVLRALAACLITNSHYTGVYPTDMIANGGLIGDILFFAVSGYCLYNIKHSFLRWYGKRVFRCYLPVVLITVVYMVLGYYRLAENGFVWWYIYPTYYHFIASIVVLYVPYYVVIKWKVLRDRIPLIMAIVGMAYLAIYLFAYNKSYYHIDTVREPMIRFLFFESMLLGAWFKQNDTQYRNNFSWWCVPAAMIAFVAYFAGKLLFSSKQSFSNWQIINQLLIFTLLYFVFRLFAGLDEKLNRIHPIAKKCIGGLAAITLEIYVVQYVLIEQIRSQLAFPLNCVAITAAILLSAVLLHLMCLGIYKLWDMLWKKIKA